MFQKMIKRTTKKPPKTDSPETIPSSSAATAAAVTVNHSSRAAVSSTVQPNHRHMPCPNTNPETVVVESLPLLREVPVPERQNIFLRKLQICSLLFDLDDTVKLAREKEIKKQTLMELVDFVQSGSGRITEIVQEELVRMISINIFRCLPPASHENTGAEPADPEEEEPYYDPAWPHLAIVYELLLRYVVSSDTDTKIAKRYIDHSFVFKLLDLFSSEDPREREYLKTILHRIYGKFMVHRPFIRKGINNIFYRFIFETERHSGIGELLEILGSIINGFALPMKEEHKLFLVRALIPLHKPKSIVMYHQQLSYCITQFVEKDYKLADTVIRGLLRYWPLTNCGKEVLFLGELEEVLEATQSAEFQKCMVPLFRQIARCQLDDDVMEKYLEGTEPDEKTIKSMIRKGTISAKFVPVLCGSAFKNKGVQPLLDAVVDYLPSPLDVPPMKGTDPDDPEIVIERGASDEEPFSGLAFKIMGDSFVGSLTFVRVYSGKLTAGSYVLNANKGKKERIGRLLEMHANSREDVKTAVAGDIIALAGLKTTITGETLCDPEKPIVLERMDFPDPVIKVAIEPKTKADIDKMSVGLVKLAQEDPSFHFSRDEEINQTIIEGMGELHLEIIVDRLKREHKVEANVGAPQVNYRESISKVSEVKYIHKKQSGGAGQFADITVRFEPMEAGSGYEFKSEIKGGAVPKEYIPGVMKGLEECMSNGVLAGYPVVDVRAALVDGNYHDVDSSVLAFQLAARGAFRDGMRKAGPRILEPIMRVEVITPEEHLGDVIGDLNSRRGQINSFGDKPGGLKVVDSLVPLAEMFQYVSTLRGMTKGRASYSMQLSKFDVVPQHIQNQIANKDEPVTAS